MDKPKGARADHDHDHGAAHDHGRNGAAHDHRHWHDEELQAIEAAFIAAFRDSPDKQALLRLSGIPLSLERPGETALKLIEVRLEDAFQVGSASPGFGSRELSYQPLPAALVGRTTKLTFVYVSADDLVEKALREIWTAKDQAREAAKPTDG